MRSFQSAPSVRRQHFLRLASEIEGQLRDAFDRRFHANKLTQSSLAAKLGIDRSAVHRRLMGRTNMTIETIADMVWALGCQIAVKITDVAHTHTNYPIPAKDPDIKVDAKPSSGSVDLKKKSYEIAL